MTADQSIIITASLALHRSLSHSHILGFPVVMLPASVPLASFIAFSAAKYSGGGVSTVLYCVKQNKNKNMKNSFAINSETFSFFFYYLRAS